VIAENLERRKWSGLVIPAQRDRLPPWHPADAAKAASAIIKAIAAKVSGTQIKSSEVDIMKTNIEIDDALMAEALRATGLEATAQAQVVELALKLLVQIKRQESIKALRGQLRWEGDLAAMRTDL